MGWYVFGNSRQFNRIVYNKVVEVAGIVHFKYHDLHPCTINNKMLGANEKLLIKTASRAETVNGFQKYTVVTEQEIESIKWLDEKSSNFVIIDTYIDTITKTEIVQS